MTVNLGKHQQTVTNQYHTKKESKKALKSISLTLNMHGVHNSLLYSLMCKTPQNRIWVEEYKMFTFKLIKEEHCAPKEY